MRNISASLLLLLAACSSTNQVVSFSPSSPCNYLIVHGGLAADFAKAECIALRTVHDRRFNAGSALRRLLAARLPGLRLCRGGEAVALVVDEYQAGPGTCIDCNSKPTDPQSGFAFISLAVNGNAEAATAEWAYWRGGSPEIMLEQFVSDLTNLYVHGVTKEPGA